MSIVITMYLLYIHLFVYSDYNHTPFGQHQVQDSFKAYSRLIVQFFAFLIRAATHPTYNHGFDETLCITLAAVEESVRYEDVNINGPDQDQMIGNVLVELWTQKYPVTPENLFPDPTIRFIMHTQVNADGTLKDPREVTGILAKFTYIMVRTCTTAQ